MTTPQAIIDNESGPGASISPSTIDGIGAVTKVFIATLAASLVGRGTVGDLSTPAGPFLTNTTRKPATVEGTNWAKASFLDLATQRSGLPDEANAPYGWQLFTGQPPSCEQIDWWNANSSTFAGNEGWWIDSNAGFLTLGFAVAGAARLPSPTLLSGELTGQLEMGLTLLAKDVPAGGQLAQGYEGRARPVAITAAADMRSTAHDMLAWLAAAPAGPGSPGSTPASHPSGSSCSNQRDVDPDGPATGILQQIVDWRLSRGVHRMTDTRSSQRGAHTSPPAVGRASARRSTRSSSRRRRSNRRTPWRSASASPRSSRRSNSSAAGPSPHRRATKSHRI